MEIHELIGWTGALLYTLAYLLLSIGRLRPDKWPYQTMNILGGLCLVINSSQTHDYPSVLTNIVWIGIGTFALYFNSKKVRGAGSSPLN